jgi:hypothetical protein
MMGRGGSKEDEKKMHVFFGLVLIGRRNFFELLTMLHMPYARSRDPVYGAVILIWKEMIWKNPGLETPSRSYHR